MKAMKTEDRPAPMRREFKVDNSILASIIKA